MPESSKQPESNADRGLERHVNPFDPEAAMETHRIDASNRSDRPGDRRSAPKQSKAVKRKNPSRQKKR